MARRGVGDNDLLAAIEAGEDAKDRAEKLLERLPSLLPDDPAAAAVLAEEMAKAVADVSAARRGGEGLENAITNPCPKCHRQMSKDGHCTRCERLDANMKTVDGLVSDLGKKGPNGKGKGWKNEPKDLGEIDEGLAADIKKANPKMKATVGTMQTIDHAQLQHALDEHGVGKEKWGNSVPITKDDLKKIPEVLSDYDEIVPGKGVSDGKKQEAVVFRKSYDDGTVCCVEIDWFSRGKKRGELKFQTMWKEKAEEGK